ncbi:MAG: filamentous hemagglutinin N-terminal domain-containing protein [Candidatus Pacebacteria bacterium]|nr:filamentous hemagglutinin N-terminal domain-containing protein [Candidatus Paceibacterota bacterium]
MLHTDRSVADINSFVHKNNGFLGSKNNKQIQGLNRHAAAGSLIARDRGLLSRLLLSSAAAVLAGVGLGGMNNAQAAPMAADASVVAGQATITNPTQQSTLVRQDSSRAVINWNGFDVGIGESVEFQVPTTTSATLNRISSSAPSLIQGSVTSNGHLYFVNPNGMIFNAGSQVTANGFVATTAAIATQSFMNSAPSVGSLRGAGSGAIEVYGELKANSIGLYAQDLMVNGTVDASNGSGVGGSVTMMADRLAAIGTVAVISASGYKDGGTINIGGNFHGTGSLVNSQFVLVESGAVISADAGTTGNGGNIVLWSDQTTIFNGKITARGGSQSGNGGLVEVSGKVNLAMNGLVDTSAAKGNAGSLLLDPGVLTITDGAAASPVSGVTNTGTLSQSPTSLPLAWGGNLSNSYRTWSSDLLDIQFGPGFNDGQTGTSTFSVTSTKVVENLALGNVTLEADEININRNVMISSAAGNDLIFVGRTTVGRGVQINNLGGDLKFFLHDNDGPASRTAGTAIGSQGDGIVFGDVASAAAGDKIILTANNIDVATTAYGDLNYKTLAREITFNAPVDFVLPAFAASGTSGGRLSVTTGNAVQGEAFYAGRAYEYFSDYDNAGCINNPICIHDGSNSGRGGYIPGIASIPEKQGYDSANINVKALVTVTNGAEVNLDLGGAAKVAGANNLATTYGGGRVVIDTAKTLTVKNLDSSSPTAFIFSAAGITQGNSTSSKIILETGVLLLQEKTINGDLYVNAGGIYKNAIDASDESITTALTAANKQSVSSASPTGITGGTALLNLTTDGKIIVAAQPTASPIGRFTAGKGIKVIGALTAGFSMSFVSGGSITHTANGVKVVAGLYIGANVTSNSGSLTLVNNGNFTVGTDGTIGAGIYINKASLLATSSRITLTNNGSVTNVLGDEISTATDKFSQIATVGIYLSGTSTASAYSFSADAKSVTIVNNGDLVYGYARQAYGVLVKDYLVKSTSGAITISQNSAMRPENLSGICTTSGNPCGHVLYIDKTDGTATADGDVFADNTTARKKVVDSTNANAVQAFSQTAGIEIYNSKLWSTQSTISLYRGGSLNQTNDGVDKALTDNFTTRVITSGGVAYTPQGTVTADPDTGNTRGTLGPYRYKDSFRDLSGNPAHAYFYIIQGVASAGNGYPVGSGIYIEGSTIETSSAANGNGNITINDAGLVQGYFGNIFDWGTDYPIFGVKFYGGVRGNTITAARDLTVTQSGLVKSRSLGLAVGIEIDKSSLTGKNNLTIQQTGAVTAYAWDQAKADATGNYYSASGMKFNKTLDAQNQNIYGIRMVAYGSTAADGVNLIGGGNNSRVILTTNETDLSLGAAISNDSTRWGAAPTSTENDRTKRTFYVAKFNNYNVKTAGLLQINLGGGKLIAHDVNLTATGITTSYTGAVPTVMTGNTKALDAGSAGINVLYRLSRPAEDTTLTGSLEVTNSSLIWHYNDGSAKTKTLTDNVSSVSGLTLFATTAAGGAVYGGISVRVPILLNTGALDPAGASTNQGLPGFTTTRDITISGNSYFDQSLTLDAGGTITQAAGTGKALTLKTGSKLTLRAGGNILLGDSGNDIGNLGTVNGQGTVTLVNSKNLTLSGNITAQGLIKFDLSAANAAASVAVLTIGANIVTSGGDVDLNVGAEFGDVSNRVGANLYKLKTSGKDLKLNFNSFSGAAITAADSVVFDLAAPAPSTSKGRYITSGSGTKNLSGTDTKFGLYSGASAPTDSTLTNITWVNYDGLLKNLPDGLDVNNFNGTLSNLTETIFGAEVNFYKVTGTITGAVNLIVGGKVNFIGTNSFTNPLNINVTGGSTNEIRQLAGLSTTTTATNVSKITVSQASGQLSLSTAAGQILLDGGKKDITDNSRTVTVGVNSLGKLGEVKAGTSTAAALTINFDGNLVLNGDLYGSAITIKRADAATTSTVILGTNITSSGGNVAIDIGTGRYLSAANFTTTPAGFKWTTSGYNMTIDSLGVGLGTETTSFDLTKTTQATDGEFTARVTVAPGKTLVIGDATATATLAANEVRLLAGDIIDKNKITAKTTTASITADAYSLRKGVYNLGGGDLELTATTGTITIGVAGSAATDVIQINGSLKLYTTNAAMNITQLGLNKLVVTDTLTLSATGAIALTSATGGNDIAKLGTVSATSVDINNMAASGTLTLTGDLTVSGVTTIKTKNNMTLAPTAAGVTEVKIIGGGTVNFEVGGTYVDNGKQLGLYSSYTSAATNTLSSAAISVFAAAWDQSVDTLAANNKTIRTQGTLTIAKTYTGSATATPGAGNLWITSNNLTHGTDTIIKVIPTSFDRFKVVTLDNSAIVTGILYTGTGTVFIDGFTSAVTGSSDIKATKIVIGNGTNNGNTPSSFAGALRLTTTTITGEGVSQNPGAGLTSGNLTIDTTAAASGTAGIVLDSSLNSLANIMSLKSKGNITINTQSATTTLKDNIVLNGVFKLTAMALYLNQDLTISGATNAVATNPSLDITATQFNDNAKKLTIDGNNAKQVKFTAGAWNLTAATTSIAIEGAGSKFDASSSFTGANLYITSTANAASGSTYRSGKTGDFISTIPGLSSSLPGKITINAAAVVETGATQNFTAPGVTYTGGGKVFIDGFSGATGASYAISGTSFVFGDGTGGAASSFSGKLSLTASGTVSQSAVLTVTDILSITINAGNGGITLNNGSNQLSILGAMTSLGGISLSSGSTVTLNGSEIKAGGAFSFTGTSLTLSADTTISGATSVAVNLSGTYTDATKKLTFSSQNLSGAAKFLSANWAMTAADGSSIVVTGGGFDAQTYYNGDIYFGSGSASGFRIASLNNSGSFNAAKIAVKTGSDKIGPGNATTGTFYFDGASLTTGSEVYNITAQNIIFIGTNRIDGKLNLKSTSGGVSQRSGSTVNIGELSINAAGEVNLTNSGNSLGRLNAIKSNTENVRLASSVTAMGLYGNIDAGSGKIIYLSGSVAIKENISTSSGAAIVLNIGSNTLSNGTDGTSARKWSTGSTALSVSVNGDSNVSLFTGSGATHAFEGTGIYSVGVYLVGEYCVGFDCAGSSGNWIGDIRGGGTLNATNLGYLNSTNAITKKNDATIEATGNLTVKTAGGTDSYKNFKSGGTLTITATQDLTLKSVSSSGNIVITTDAGKKVTLESGASIDSGSQTNSVRITSSGLTLAGAVSSKGALSLLLGNGEYNIGANNGWDLQTNSLVFQAGSVLKTGGVAVDNDTSVFTNITTVTFSTSAVTTQRTDTGSKVDFIAGRDQYFTNIEDIDSNDYYELKRQLGGSVDLHPLSDLTRIKTTGTVAGFKPIDSGIMKWGAGNGGGTTRLTATGYTVTFLNVSNLNLTSTILADLINMKTIVFAGTTRSGGSLDLSSLSNKTVVLGENSQITRTLKLSDSTELLVQSGAIVPNLVVTGSGFLSKLTVSGTVNIRTAVKANSLGFDPSDYGSVNLTMDNSGNEIGSISGSFSGGYIRIVSNSASTISVSGLKTGGGSISLTALRSNVTFSTVNTGGGSIVVTARNGDFTATGLVAGRVAYNAGRVDLQGSFAGSSGRSASASIDNSAAGAVVGDSTTDTSLSLKGRGSIILGGSLTSLGGGEIAIAESVGSVTVAAKEAKLTSKGGVITILPTRVDDIMAGTNGLSLDVGGSGKISFRPDMAIGARSSLGWVEIKATSLSIPNLSITTGTGASKATIMPSLTDFSNRDARRWGVGAY